MKRTFKIGHGVGLAPMAGVSDLPFRLLCGEMGADYCVTEMLSAKGFLYAPRHTPQVMRLYARAAHEAPLGLQLFGREPDMMARAAAELAPLGFAFVDINMGCPAHKIVSSGEGSALMREPRTVARVIEEVVCASPLPVTVKIRSGWDLSQLNAPQIAHIAQECGAVAVCVHARTREQHYSGRADLDMIARVKAAVSIPVIGNGDVTGADSALEMMRRTGCDGVMIGRAAQGNPWVFAEVSKAMHRSKTSVAALASASGLPVAPVRPTPPGKTQRVMMALRHAQMMCAFIPGAQAVLEMRKHVAWYIHGMPGSAQLREKVNRAADMAQLKALLMEFLQA